MAKAPKQLRKQTAPKPREWHQNRYNMMLAKKEAAMKEVPETPQDMTSTPTMPPDWPMVDSSVSSQDVHCLLFGNCGPPHGFCKSLPLNFHLLPFVELQGQKLDGNKAPVDPRLMAKKPPPLPSPKRFHRNFKEEEEFQKKQHEKVTNLDDRKPAASKSITKYTASMAKHGTTRAGAIEVDDSNDSDESDFVSDEDNYCEIVNHSPGIDYKAKYPYSSRTYPRDEVIDNGQEAAVKAVVKVKLEKDSDSPNQEGSPPVADEESDSTYYGKGVESDDDHDSDSNQDSEDPEDVPSSKFAKKLAAKKKAEAQLTTCNGYETDSTHNAAEMPTPRGVHDPDSVDLVLSPGEHRGDFLPALDLLEGWEEIPPPRLSKKAPLRASTNYRYAYRTKNSDFPYHQALTGINQFNDWDPDSPYYKDTGPSPPENKFTGLPRNRENSCAWSTKENESDLVNHIRERIPLFPLHKNDRQDFLSQEEQIRFTKHWQVQFWLSEANCADYDSKVIYPLVDNSRSNRVSNSSNEIYFVNAMHCPHGLKSVSFKSDKVVLTHYYYVSFAKNTKTQEIVSVIRRGSIMHRNPNFNMFLPAITEPGLEILHHVRKHRKAECGSILWIHKTICHPFVYMGTYTRFQLIPKCRHNLGEMWAWGNSETGKEGTVPFTIHFLRTQCAQDRVGHLGLKQTLLDDMERHWGMGHRRKFRVDPGASPEYIFPAEHPVQLTLEGQSKWKIKYPLGFRERNCQIKALASAFACSNGLRPIGEALMEELAQWGKRSQWDLITEVLERFGMTLTRDGKENRFNPLEPHDQCDLVIAKVKDKFGIMYPHCVVFFSGFVFDASKYWALPITQHWLDELVPGQANKYAGLYWSFRLQMPFPLVRLGEMENPRKRKIIGSANSI